MSIKIKTDNISKFSRKIKEISFNNIQRNFLSNSFAALEKIIDPKKKDSFSSERIQTWTNTVTERVLHYLFEENKK